MAKLGNNGSGKTDWYGMPGTILDAFFSGEVARGFDVVAQASPVMSVKVNYGVAAIPTGSGASTSKLLVRHDTTAGEDVTITTANGSNPRRDLIVAYYDIPVINTTNPNNPNALKFAAVAGTPSGSPADPSAGTIQTAIGASNPYIILARVLVGTSVTQITNANITDLRTTVSAATETRLSETSGNFVASGAIWSAVSGLNGTMSLGVAYINGKRIALSAIASQAFVASKDTYVSVDVNGVVSIANAVANNAASPALPANSVWLAKVVTSGAAITSVVKDGVSSLGVAIYPRVRSTLDLYNPIKFSVYRSAAWTTANGTLTVVNFDTKTFDTGSNVDVVTNKGRFTAPIAGFYQFNTSVFASVGVGTAYTLGIYKNGTEYRRLTSDVISATQNFAHSGSALISLAVNDYVEIYFSGNGSAGITGAATTSFDGLLVSAT